MQEFCRYPDLLRHSSELHRALCLAEAFVEVCSAYDIKPPQAKLLPFSKEDESPAQ
jgi:hypothetical protein